VVDKDTGRGARDGLSWLEYLRVWYQYLLPHHLLSAIMYRATRIRFAPWKNWQIRWFCARYGVRLDEALEPCPLRYPDFNSFFTRALRPDARPVAGDDDTLVSPVDGIVSQVGTLEEDAILQAKGHRYSLASLLGEDSAAAADLRGGHFITIYLAPRDYHRVHMPTAGELHAMTYRPGRLFSVNPLSVRLVPRLFTRNERIACLFETPAGSMALVLVGAMLVGGLETVWAGAVAPPHGGGRRTWRYGGYGEAGARAVALARGEEMGRFNMGSTVVVVLPRGRARWAQRLGPEVRVTMGEEIGKILPGGLSKS